MLRPRCILLIGLLLQLERTPGSLEKRFESFRFLDRPFPVKVLIAVEPFPSYPPNRLTQLLVELGLIFLYPLPEIFVFTSGAAQLLADMDQVPTEPFSASSRLF